VSDLQQRDASNQDRMLSHTMEIRAIREESREVDFICSTEALDAHGTVIKQDGWDLSRFTRNPVVLWCHNRSVDELPVGHAVSFGVENNKLIATIRIATIEANPKAEHVWQSIRQKTLRGVSVGFMPLEYHWEKDAEGGDEHLVFDRQVLCEISITPLPSNPEGLARTRQIAMDARALPLPNKTTATDSPPQEKPAAERGEQERTAMSDQITEIAALKTNVATREAEVRAKEADLIESRKLLDTERAAKVAIERELDKARADLVAITARASKAEGDVVERDVRALVGVKITPAEVEEQIELAKSNRSLFDKLMSKRSVMQEMVPAIPAEPNTETRGASVGIADDELAAAAMKGV